MPNFEWLQLIVLILLTTTSGVGFVYALGKSLVHSFRQTSKTIELYQRLRPGHGWWHLLSSVLREPFLIYSNESKGAPERKAMWTSYWKSAGYGLVSMVVGICFLFSAVFLLLQLEIIH